MRSYPAQSQSLMRMISTVEKEDAKKTHRNQRTPVGPGLYIQGEAQLSFTRICHIPSVCFILTTDQKKKRRKKNYQYFVQLLLNSQWQM